MWWSRPLLVVGLLALGPAGCGFHPLYARPSDSKASAVADEMAAVSVQMIPDRNGQILRNALVSRLCPNGEAAVPKYQLTVKLTEIINGMAHADDGTATLEEIVMTASYDLVDIKRQVGTSGQATTMIGADFLGPRYASVAAERDGERRAMQQVAEQIVGQIAMYIKDPSSRPPLGTQMQTPGMQHYQLLQGMPLAPDQPTGPQSPGLAPP